MFGTLRRYIVGGIVFFFSVGILSRIMSDPNSPGIISGFFAALSNLFKNTTNG